MVKIGGQPVIETDDSQVLELMLDQNKRLSKEENSKELFKKELVMFGWGSNDYGQLGCGTGIIIKYFFKNHFALSLISRIIPHASLTMA